MSLFGKKEKEEIARLKAMIPPEQFTLSELQSKIHEAEGRLNSLAAQISTKTSQLENIQNEIIGAEEAVMLQSFGVYTPRYALMNSDEYKAKLLDIRTQQKEMIKQKRAVTGASNWTVNGSAAQGKKMVADMQKLLLRAFNSECDDIIEHVRYSNLEASEKRISSSNDAISKLGSMMSVSIQPHYYKLKIEELYLAFEYQRKKQEEKEAQKEARAELREAAKLAKEIEESRKKLQKEQSHYQNAIAKLQKQLESASDSERAAMEEKKAELEAQLQKIDIEMKAVDYREANQKAGYVYIISNIGAFGEGVYKIGMTRRLEPMDRIDELGDASVPFNFDVHAMIFSDDAPALEAALHKAFESKKLNMVNTRREFFRVSLDEIKAVVKSNFDKSVEFIEIAPAEQFRESMAIKESIAIQ